MSAATSSVEALVDLIRVCQAESGAITGYKALGLAFLIHGFGMDDREQWGCAYFRCPDCGQALDCTGSEEWSSHIVASCQGRECDDGELAIVDLRLSEGWVLRLLIGHAEDSET